MLNVKEIGVLLQIIKRSNRISSKMKNINYEDLCLNEDLKEIVCFNIFQIGELVGKLSEAFTKKNNKIIWSRIKGMRNRIVHGYSSINFEVVWDTINISIPELENYCTEILEKEKINI